jgi:hypothetical protein
LSEIDAVSHRSTGQQHSAREADTGPCLPCHPYFQGHELTLNCGCAPSQGAKQFPLRCPLRKVDIAPDRPSLRRSKPDAISPKICSICICLDFSSSASDGPKLGRRCQEPIATLCGWFAEKYDDCLPPTPNPAKHVKIPRHSAQEYAHYCLALVC